MELREPAAEPLIGSTLRGLDEVLEQIVQQVSPDSRVIHCNAVRAKGWGLSTHPGANHVIAVTETGSAQLEQALHVFGHALG